jgi:predicted SnoaL-like aldol condensation-catalyzing enzyme
MMPSRKNQICDLLKSIETGDSAPVSVVDENKYIQHNPQTHEGSEGLAALFKRLSKTNPTVNIVRVFEDGDYVFAHTEYNFERSNIGFEIFRFEDDQAVEHWDNIQPRLGPNSSGHTMVDGPTEPTDFDRTEINRRMVRAFVENVLVNRKLGELENYICIDEYTQHDPKIADGLPALREALQTEVNGTLRLEYTHAHQVLAEGNFVLSASEGFFSGAHSAFYDLFRVSKNKIVEQWNTIEAISPREKWKNDNGKF